MPKQRTGGVTWNEARQAWIARLDWTDENGKRRCRKQQVENKTRGKELLKKWIAEQSAHGVQIITGERLTFQQLADIYAKQKLTAPVYEGETKVSGLRSHRSLKYCLKALAEHFGTRRIQLITHSDIAAYRAARLNTKTKRKQSRCVASVNRELELLRAMLNFAWRSGWLTRNPFDFGDPLISKAQETHRERILTPDEEERLLSVCTGHRAILKPILICALDTAMRRGELLKLTWADVDLTEGLIRLRATTTKTLKARTVGITARLRHELQTLWDNSPKEADGLVFGIKDNFKRSFNTACHLSGVEGFRFHDCRHTAITRMIQRGMAPMEVMKISGHTQMQTFVRYVNTDGDAAKRAAAALDEFHFEGAYRAFTPGESPLLN